MSAQRDGVLAVIEHDGDLWRVLATGATDEHGRVYCQLASTTRARQQRNGANPIQIADWVDPLKLAEAWERSAFEGWWPSVGQTIGKVAAWEAWRTRAALARVGGAS